ncbi:MAG TPA: hypothetical protein VEC19_12795 [Usitatibacter sp.]|nr:hypothetical protein [Usitatibacter sp.]
MDQQFNPVDLMLIAAGISTVYNADDWDFDAAKPRPLHKRFPEDSDAVPPTLN